MVSKLGKKPIVGSKKGSKKRRRKRRRKTTTVPKKTTAVPNFECDICLQDKSVEEKYNLNCCLAGNICLPCYVKIRPNGNKKCPFCRTDIGSGSDEVTVKNYDGILTNPPFGVSSASRRRRRSASRRRSRNYAASIW